MDQNTNYTSKVNYLKRKWEYLVEEVKNGSFAIDIFTPVLLIDEIISEIIDNSLCNEKNYKFFCRKLRECYQSDNILKTHCRYEITRTLSFLASPKGKEGYILQLCYAVKNKIDNGIYIKAKIDELADLMSSDEQLTKPIKLEITCMCSKIISGFIQKEFDIDYIAKLANNVFSNYTYLGNGIIISDYPHTIRKADFVNTEGQYNEEKHTSALKSYFSELTITDRIRKLNYFFDEKREKIYFVFLVNGFVCDKNIKIGDIEFLTLQNEENCKLFQESFLQRDRAENQMWAKITMNRANPHTSKNKAIEKLENTLNLMPLTFDLKVPLNIDLTKYIILDEKLNLIGGKRMVDKTRAPYLKHYVLTLSDDNDYKCLDGTTKYFEFINKTNKNDVERRLTNAVYWNRKGIESFRNEDKLLNFWIAIENIFKTSEANRKNIFRDKDPKVIDIIQNIVAMFYSRRYIFKVREELYTELYFGIECKKYFLPEDLIENVRLSPESDEAVNLTNLIRNIGAIKEALSDKDILIQDKLEYAEKFYTEFDFFQEELSKVKEQIKDDILMLYRYRNLIVHNAQYTNPILSIYADKARIITELILKKIAWYYSVTNFDIEELLIYIVMQHDLFFDNIKTEFDNMKP